MAGKPESRGYVREWLQTVELTQADMCRKLGYSKAKAFAIWHARQRLNEDILEEVAALVNAHPYEILLTPERAFQLRRLEAVVADAVRQVDAPTDAGTPPAKTTPLRKVG